MVKVVRNQKIYAIRRNGSYWLGQGSWIGDIRLARILPKRQAESEIRIAVGLSGCELVEVVPVENE